jgi:hypothetical protein
MLDHRLAMPTTDLLHGVRKGATYKETLEALEDLFADQHPAPAYRSQLTRTQSVEEILQKFSGTTEQLAHSAYPALPEEEGWQGVH